AWNFASGFFCFLGGGCLSRVRTAGGAGSVNVVSAFPVVCHESNTVQSAAVMNCLHPLSRRFPSDAMSPPDTRVVEAERVSFIVTSDPRLARIAVEITDETQSRRGFSLTANSPRSSPVYPALMPPPA